MATISPDYMFKGVKNPYYEMDQITQNNVKRFLSGKGIIFEEIIFKCVYKPEGEEIGTSRGKFTFQIVNKVDNEEYELPYHIGVTKKEIKGHYGMATRKDSTASSNVNEYLSLHFLVNDFVDAKTFMEYISNASLKTKKTGVLKGEGTEVTYGELNELVDKDETPVRDIEIGYKNSIAVKSDIGRKKIKKLFWVPRAKPPGVADNNPSDIVLQFDDDTYFGYSNKIAAGADATPKFNTNITAFYSKLQNKDRTQLKSIEKLINKSWNEARDSVPKTKKFAYNIIQSFDIEKEGFSETSSKNSFSGLATVFKKDGLDFYTDGFYYPFRNNLIKNLGNHLKDAKNLKYFLNTIYTYTYGDPTIKYTPCPYKLLIGRENGPSEIKDVSDNKSLKNILMVQDEDQMKNITFDYDNKSQSFKIKFSYGNLNVEIPTTCRTRATGGWSGKSLYINSAGLKII